MFKNHTGVLTVYCVFSKQLLYNEKDVFVLLNKNTDLHPKFVSVWKIHFIKICILKCTKKTLRINVLQSRKANNEEGAGKRRKMEIRAREENSMEKRKSTSNHNFNLISILISTKLKNQQKGSHT